MRRTTVSLAAVCRIREARGQTRGAHPANHPPWGGVRPAAWPPPPLEPSARCPAPLAVAVGWAPCPGSECRSLTARLVAELHPERVTRLVLIGSPGSLGNNQAVLEFQTAVRALKDPVPPRFARELQGGAAHVPLPEPFFERSRAAWRPRFPGPGWSCTRRRATAPTGSARSGSPPTWPPSCARGSRLAASRQPSRRGWDLPCRSRPEAARAAAAAWRGDSRPSRDALR
jgi:pimeloyl-ACP methyl ester carboxylesterase